MIGIALKLLGIGKFLREAAGSVFSAAMRYPWQAALIVALCLAGWQWRGKSSALAERDAARTELTATVKASKQATALALKQRAADQVKFAKLKKEADNGHSTALADADRRTTAFIRLRTNRGDCAAKANPASESPSAGFPEITSTETVMVSSSDVKICAAASVYADGAHKWALGLIDNGVGE